MNGEKIGRGAYGTVYLKNGKAIKNFPSPGTGNSMIREIIASKYLEECPNILTIEDFDLVNRRHYSKYYDSTLKKFMSSVSGLDDEQKKLSKHPNSLTDEQRMSLIKLSKLTQKEKILKIRSLLDGIVYMHSRDIVHSDLKPNNIFYSTEEDIFIIGDLGFVAPSKYTKSGRTCRYYREPEPKNNTAHDIYSLGVLLIELLCNISIRKIYTYEKLVSFCRIEDRAIENMIISMIDYDYKKRPNIFGIYYTLYSVHPKKYKSKIQDDVQIDKKLMHIMKANSIKNDIKCYLLQSYVKKNYHYSERESLYYSMYICTLLFGGNVSADKVLSKLDISSRHMIKYTSKLLKDKNVAEILYS